MCKGDISSERTASCYIILLLTNHWSLESILFGPELLSSKFQLFELTYYSVGLLIETNFDIDFDSNIINLNNFDFDFNSNVLN